MCFIGRSGISAPIYIGHIFYIYIFVIPSGRWTHHLFGMEIAEIHDPETYDFLNSRITIVGANPGAHLFEVGVAFVSWGFRASIFLKIIILFK